MKQKDWCWCGAVLSALMMFIFQQSVQGVLAGIAGGLCALAAVILFGCGLRADAQEKSAAELKRREAEQEQLEAQQRIYAEALDHIQRMAEALKEELQSAGKSAEHDRRVQRESTAVAIGEIQTLRQAVTDESRSQLNALAQFSEDVKKYFEFERIQTEESARLMCEMIAEQHTAIRKVLESQSKESANYYRFMVDQPWAEIKAISQTLQYTADQADSISSLMDAVQFDTKKQFKETLNKLKENGESLQEKLQYVCETLEKQGQENRDAMERVIQGYSDITAQDIEVLTALAKNTGV